MGHAYGHSCRTLLWDTLVRHSCRTLLWVTLTGHSSGTLLWGTLVGHSCRKLWWSCGTLLRDTLVGHSSRTLLWDTLVAHQQQAAFTLYTSMFRAPQWHGASQTHFPPRPRKSTWCDITEFRHKFCHTLETNISHDPNHPAHQRHAAFTPPCFALSGTAPRKRTFQQGRANPQGAATRYHQFKVQIYHFLFFLTWTYLDCRFTTVCSRMRSEGFSFNSGGLGVEPCS